MISILKFISGLEKYCLAVVTGIKHIPSVLVMLAPLLLSIPVTLSFSPATDISFPRGLIPGEKSLSATSDPSKTIRRENSSSSGEKFLPLAISYPATVR